MDATPVTDDIRNTLTDNGADDVGNSLTDDGADDVRNSVNDDSVDAGDFPADDEESPLDLVSSPPEQDEVPADEEEENQLITSMGNAATLIAVNRQYLTI